jgi:transposase
MTGNGDKARIIAEIVPRANSRPRCSGCGKPRPGCDRMPKPREFEFIPIWNIPVSLSYTMRRVDCPTCGIKVEAVPWAQGKHACCDIYRHFLASWAKRLSWKETADGDEPVLKNARYCFFKRRSNLTIRQATKLRDLLKYDLKSISALALKESFNAFCQYGSPRWAG